MTDQALTQDTSTDLAPVPSFDQADEISEVAELPPLPDDRFADRELSWLAFNERVLELAEDPTMHLLERCRFAAIFASNLDEFFMVRVAGLKRRIAAGLAVTTASGLTPRQVLEVISVRAHELQARHAAVFSDQLVPSLAGEGITFVHWDDIGAGEQDRLHKYFRRQIFPVLTPLAVDPAHPFPYISGLSLNLAVVVRNPQALAEARDVLKGNFNPDNAQSQKILEQVVELSKQPVTVKTPDLAGTLSAVQAYLERRNVNADEPGKAAANPAQETSP